MTSMLLTPRSEIDARIRVLQQTLAEKGMDGALIVHHTDAVREYAYDRDTAFGKLDKGLDAAPAQGWVVIDMAKDWKTVFPD